MLCYYEATDLTLEEAQQLLTMLTRVPRLVMWHGGNNSFTYEAWHEQWVTSLDRDKVRISPDARVSSVPGYDGIYVVPIWITYDNEPEWEQLVNLADLLYLNTVPCTVKRNGRGGEDTTWWDHDWIWLSHMTRYWNMCGDTVIYLQKMDIDLETSGAPLPSNATSMITTSTMEGGRVWLLSKRCTLRTLLEWQQEASAKKSVAKEQNNEQSQPSATLKDDEERGAARARRGVKQQRQRAETDVRLITTTIGHK